MQVKVGKRLIVDSEDIVFLHEPGRFPVAYFRLSDVVPGTLERCDHVTINRDLGTTIWYTVRADEECVERGAWQHTDLPDSAEALYRRIAFSWRPVDLLYESWRAIDSAYQDSTRRARSPRPHG